MSVRGVLSKAAVMVVALGFTREASAFCRTTTCNEATETCRLNDRGCVRDGVTVIWTELPIVYRFSAVGSEKLNDKKMRAAVKAAFSAWESVKCPDGRNTSVRFENGPDIRTDKPLNRKQAKEPFGIYFRDEEWPYSKASDSLALTNQIYGEVYGRIEYADIEVNTAEAVFSLGDEDSDATDFQAVMIHEAGHYLGLAHSKDDDSIMLPNYCTSTKSDRCTKGVEEKRKLSDDDIDGVCAIYPPRREDEDGTTGATTAATSGCAQTSSRRADFAGGAALVFLAAALVRRRARSSR